MIPYRTDSPLNIKYLYALYKYACVDLSFPEISVHGKMLYIALCHGYRPLQLAMIMGKMTARVCQVILQAFPLCACILIL